MGTLRKLVDIANRLDMLQNSAEWITRETVHLDNSVSQTGTLITVLAEDVRDKVNVLVRELEEVHEAGGLN